jgi:hypothetical protein
MLAGITIAWAVVLLFAAVHRVEMIGTEATLSGHSLNNLKEICVACKEYAIDHEGRFPPTLEALVPAFLADRNILRSPLQPNDPIGYNYTPPDPKDDDSDTVVVIEDKFAPSLTHHRIVIHADSSACVLPSP